MGFKIIFHLIIYFLKQKEKSDVIHCSCNKHNTEWMFSSLSKAWNTQIELNLKYDHSFVQKMYFFYLIIVFKPDIHNKNLNIYRNVTKNSKSFLHSLWQNTFFGIVEERQQTITLASTREIISDNITLIYKEIKYVYMHMLKIFLSNRTK